jgi:hypothetical protein
MSVPTASSALCALLAAARAHYDQHVGQDPDWPLYGTIEARCPRDRCFIECEPAVREVIRLPFFLDRDAAPPVLVCPACTAPLNILGIELQWGIKDRPIWLGAADVGATFV